MNEREPSDDERAIPDRVRPGMEMLICGINPSLHAARTQIPYIGPGNRFWPALEDAGLGVGEPDPDRLLVHRGIGFTDFVARATPRASDLTVDEQRDGLAHLIEVVEANQPRVVCIVGLGPWRAAVDRKAMAGWQPDPPVAAPVYVMPSTSGLNASTSRTELAEHFRRAWAGPKPSARRT